MSVFLDISRLRAGVDSVSRRLEPSAFAGEDRGFVVAEAVDLTAEAHKDAKKIRLVGRVKTTLSAECSRCLEPFAIPLDAAFDALFLPASDDVAQAEREVAEEDLGISYYDADTIDLSALALEQFYLALPMKPLCRPDCRGLCPVCGVNWNHESCTCQPEWVDPRLEALRRFSQ